MTERIKVTYSTLASPDPRLHQLYDEAVKRAKADFGKNYPLFINGKERFAEKTFEKRSPVNLDWVMGTFQYGTEQDANDAITAARAAFPAWSKRPWQERVAIIRKAADLISDRLFYMGANMSLEIGKNRLEALGDVEETADLHPLQLPTQSRKTTTSTLNFFPKAISIIIAVSSSPMAFG